MHHTHHTGWRVGAGRYRKCKEVEQGESKGTRHENTGANTGLHLVSGDIMVYL